MLLDHPVGAIWFTADPAILLLIGRNPAAIPKNLVPYVAPDSLRALMLETTLPLALVLLTLAAVPLVDDMRGPQH